MSTTFNPSILYPSLDYKAMAATIRKACDKRPKTREESLQALVATGMFTKTGKLKKQFR